MYANKRICFDSYGSPSELQVAAPNLETKRAGIHRMQRNKKEGRTGRSGHFEKCHRLIRVFSSRCTSLSLKIPS